jgi:nitrogen fixation-related uncharacterized protein
MTAAGYILLGLAVGVILGALAAYGWMFAWAVKYGEGDDK